MKRRCRSCIPGQGSNCYDFRATYDMSGALRSPEIRLVLTRVALVVLWVLAASTALAQPSHPERKSVLLLMALRGTAPAAQTTEMSFRHALIDKIGAPVDLHVEYLDLLDGSSTPYV